MKDKVDDINSANSTVKDIETTNNKLEDIYSTNYIVKGKVKDKLYK